MDATTRLADLIAALPEDDGARESPREALRELFAGLGERPVPTGRLLRLWPLGTLTAKLASAYFAHWLRSGFAGAEEKERRRSEAHLAAAVKVLESMGYLRGTIHKVGQILACYPDVLPVEFHEALSLLHFEAPPMHFSLIREHLRDELGRDVDEAFAEFEPEAFAAASLGQVHRARLHSGERVAVKVQYPNIGRAIRDDLRNMSALLLPMRLTSVWENLREQYEEIRRQLELETDYEVEASWLERARTLFREDEGIVVPRVHRSLSTRRVLVMGLLEGVHLPDFLARNPSVEMRDLQGDRILRAGLRIFWKARAIYADPNPGNFLFLDDGRLGLLDFGCCREFTDEEWGYMMQGVAALEHGGEYTRRVAARGACFDGPEQVDEDHMRVLVAFCDWYWEPMRQEGRFDFGAEDYLRRGMGLYGELLRKRYVRSKPVNVWMTRCLCGVRAFLYRLGARVEAKKINDEETAHLSRDA